MRNWNPYPVPSSVSPVETRWRRDGRYLVKEWRYTGPDIQRSRGEVGGAVLRAALLLSAWLLALLWMGGVIL